MAINLKGESAEKPINFGRGADVLERLTGVRPDPSTLWRWKRKGIDGVRLECVRVGRRLFTTEEALIRFVNNCAEADNKQPLSTGPALRATAPATRTPAQRRAAIEAANRVLDRAGI